MIQSGFELVRLLPHPVQQSACHSVLSLVSLASFYTCYSALFSRATHSTQNFCLFLLSDYVAKDNLYYLPSAQITGMSHHT